MTDVPALLEIVEVETIEVSCDGDGGALGHPKVFLTLVDGEVKCPYCDKKFVLKAGVTPESGH